MNEADTFIEHLDLEAKCETNEQPKKRERKAKSNEQACAEVVSTNVKLKLIRACYINGEIKEPGNIVEVDEQTAQEFLKPFDVQPTFSGYRAGNRAKETIVRAERLN